MFFAALAFAQENAPAISPKTSLQSTLWMMAIIFAIFYFLIIMPQRRKQKEHERKLNELKEKDRVVTAGGILGTITRVKGNIIELKIDDNVKIEVLKSSISNALEKDQ